MLNLIWPAAEEQNVSKDKEVLKISTSHTWRDPKTQMIFKATNINDAHFEPIVKTVADDEKINFDTIKHQKLENTNIHSGVS